MVQFEYKIFGKKNKTIRKDIRCRRRKCSSGACVTHSLTTYLAIYLSILSPFAAVVTAPAQYLIFFSKQQEHGGRTVSSQFYRLFSLIFVFLRVPFISQIYSICCCCFHSVSQSFGLFRTACLNRAFNAIDNSPFASLVNTNICTVKKKQHTDIIIQNAPFFNWFAQHVVSYFLT